MASHTQLILSLYLGSQGRGPPALFPNLILSSCPRYLIPVITVTSCHRLLGQKHKQGKGTFLCSNISSLNAEINMTREFADTTMKHQPQLKWWLLNRDRYRHPVCTCSSTSYRHKFDFFVPRAPHQRQILYVTKRIWEFSGTS